MLMGQQALEWGLESLACLTSSRSDVAAAAGAVDHG